MRPYKNAFTLIELLVVIAIIVLLVGILTPTVNTARKTAQASTVKTLIFTLDSNLDLYKSEFGSYPPSFWKTNQSTPGGNPFSATNQDNLEPTLSDGATVTLPSNYSAFGAQTLLWAMVGADFKGTPGFGRSLKDLYALDNAKKPQVRRMAPFVDVNKIEIGLDQTGAFNNTNSDFQRALPYFSDVFGNPILYYKYTTDSINGNANDPATYWAQHNAPITGTPSYKNNSNGNFDLSVKGNYLGYSNGSFAQPVPADGLYGFLTDRKLKRLNGQNALCNQDRFVLISAGVDGQYGTKDDLFNFQRQD